jgi:hypothetical protein
MPEQEEVHARPIKAGDACLVLSGRYEGAVVQVVELPNRNHKHTYKVRHWVTNTHSYTFFCVRAELQYIE